MTGTAIIQVTSEALDTHLPVLEIFGRVRMVKYPDHPHEHAKVYVETSMVPAGEHLCRVQIMCTREPANRRVIVTYDLEFLS